MIDPRAKFAESDFFIDKVVSEFAHIILIYGMTEQKHFKYEGHVELKALNLDEEAEIAGYQFLVPCNIKLKIKGRELNQVVNVNLPEQKIFDQNGKEWSKALTEKFFAFMIQATTLPEDFYAADQDTVDQAGEAKQEFDQIRSQQFNEVL